MYDLNGTQIDPFIENYRNSLKEQYDTAVDALNQQRDNDFQSIMSNANTRRMLHSNFTERDKIKYDTSSYTPSLIKTRQAYQSGLDTLRTNAINLYNQLKSVQDAIDTINATSNTNAS